MDSWSWLVVEARNLLAHREVPIRIWWRYGFQKGSSSALCPTFPEPVWDEEGRHNAYGCPKVWRMVPPSVINYLFRLVRPQEQNGLAPVSCTTCQGQRERQNWMSYCWRFRRSSSSNRKDCPMVGVCTGNLRFEVEQCGQAVRQGCFTESQSWQGRSPES